MEIDLNAGKLTTHQLSAMLSSFRGEIFFFDCDKRLQYYKQPADMNYYPQELGRTFDELQIENAQKAWTQIQTGAKTVDFPAENNSLHRFYVDHYEKVVDKDHNLVGMLRQIQDVFPLVDYYLKQTGQKLVDDQSNHNGKNFRETDELDAETGASEYL
ncbi:PAS domain-containing protein [uncultured Lactobacillus sp.]|uniref:PAS domain-containing protein n=1 Tax=uncultured Lactobacillus sp. TaxID=153152 RepID=UPI0026263997|nr:PAS domain-containing protein [uncultured Lactobacillus sp.]